MRMALDVLRDSVDSWTVGYSEYQYPVYTIEAGGPKFMEFIEWLKRTPYGTEVETRKVEVSIEDEGISW